MSSQQRGTIVRMPPRSLAPYWTVLIPVKETHVAKSRLYRLSQQQRATLAVAFAVDAASAALECPWVRRVVAVTNDAAAREELTALSVMAISDAPDAGLNAALRHGEGVVRQMDADTGVAAMSADLPALTPGSLSAVFGAERGPRWFVPDAIGLGTTLLAARAPVSLQPMFGPRSRAAHKESGAAEVIVPGLEGLRRDVDTDADLSDAVRLGVGPRTDKALTAHL